MATLTFVAPIIPLPTLPTIPILPVPTLPAFPTIMNPNPAMPTLFAGNYFPCTFQCIPSVTNCGANDIPCLCQYQNRMEALLRTTPCWEACKGYAENADEYAGLLCRDWGKGVRGTAGGVGVVGSGNKGMGRGAGRATAMSMVVLLILGVVL